MALFIAIPPLDPAANELRGIKRETQEEAEEVAASKSLPNQPWSVYELLECARTIVDAPRLVRSREPAPKLPANDTPRDAEPLAKQSTL